MIQVSGNYFLKNKNNSKNFENVPQFQLITNQPLTFKILHTIASTTTNISQKGWNLK